MGQKQGGSPKLGRSSHLKGKWQSLRDRRNKETHKLRAIERDRKRIAKKARHDARRVEKHKPERGDARKQRRMYLPQIAA